MIAPLADVDVLQLYPGGRCTTTAKVSGDSGTGDMGIVSTHRVNEPHRCTCNGSKALPYLRMRRHLEQQLNLSLQL